VKTNCFPKRKRYVKMTYKMLILSLCLGFHLSAQATIYKWQDANGEIHYSSTPPDNSNATTIHPQTQPSSSAEQERARMKKIQSDLQKTQEQEAAAKDKAKKEAEEQKARAINCDRAQTHLAAIESRPRIRMQYSQGTELLTPEQRDEEIQKTKEDIEKYCSPAKQTTP